MRFSRPSPAMVVALVALVFAMTGTGIAAKTALIDGAAIKNKSINGKKLAAHSITPKGYALIAVKLPKAKKSSAHTSQSAADQSKVLTTADAAATLITPTSGWDTADMQQALTGNGVDTGSGTPTTGPVGAAGPAGAPGADAGATMTARGSLTANPPVNFFKFMAVTGAPAKVGNQPVDVATVTPAASFAADAVTVSVIGPWPSRASSIVISMLVNEIGTSVQTLGCTVTEAQPTCTVTAPRSDTQIGLLKVPASSRLAWSAQVITKPVTPPAVPPPVEDFDISASFQTTLT